jgi:hypothetical protein
MAKVEKDFEDLLRLFNKYQVKYCIVGAYAIAFYSVPRYTKDLDIFLEPSIENAKNILLALREFGFESLSLTVDDFSQKGKIIQLGYEPVRIDLITSISGIEFSESWKGKKKGLFGKIEVFFISKKHLISNKKQSGRAQDLADLKRLQNT